MLENLLYLLRLALSSDRQPVRAGDGTVGKCSLEQGAALTEEKWRELLELAGNHYVTGIMIDGISFLPEAQRPPLPVVLDMALEIDAVETGNRRISVTLQKLLSFFSARNLHPLVVKGPAVAALYPIPGHRAAGDIDFFFDGSEFEAARDAVRNAGAGPFDVIREEGPDGSFDYMAEDVYVEHHRLLYDSSCQFSSLERGGSESLKFIISTHILKHAMGTNLYLKQLCDYAVVRMLYGSPDGSLSAVAGIHRWQRLLDDFTDWWFEGKMDSAAGAAPLMRRLCRGAGVPGSKAATVAAFIRNLPFSLRYAPREWCHTVGGLIRGNLDL